MEVRDALYIIFGYLLGSILFARLGGLIFKKTDIMAESLDKNPGTMNAFTSVSYTHLDVYKRQQL